MSRFNHLFKKKPLHILLVEDNEGDILLTIEALEEEEINFTSVVVKDGWEAIQFLNNKGKYIDERLPDTILLDINLPKMNGIEVLKNIKSNKLLQHIPITMLTTSSSAEDLKICLFNKANFFQTKPLDTGLFIKNLNSLIDLNTSHTGTSSI